MPDSSYFILQKTDLMVPKEMTHVAYISQQFGFVLPILMRLCFHLFFVVVIVVIKNLVDLETLIQFRVIIWRKNIIYVYIYIKYIHIFFIDSLEIFPFCKHFMGKFQNKLFIF